MPLLARFGCDPGKRHSVLVQAPKENQRVGVAIKRAKPDPVAKASRSEATASKARSKRTRRDEPAHSFESLLCELALLTRNTVTLPGTEASFEKLAKPSPLQARALELAAGS